mgnify:CR=1 FL=1
MGEIEGGIWIYVCIYQIYLYISGFLCFKSLQPRQRESNGAYIRQGKHLTYKLSKGKGVIGVQGLLEKLGQLVGFLRKPRKGVKASSRSLEQRVQEKGPKGVQRLKIATYMHVE